MVTIAGTKMATRVGTSLLKAAFAEELVVETLEEYEELAVALATDSERLFQVRKKKKHTRIGWEHMKDTSHFPPFFVAVGLDIHSFFLRDGCVVACLVSGEEQTSSGTCGPFFVFFVSM